MADPFTIGLVILAGGSIVGGGLAKADALKAQEKAALLQAKNEELNGREQALQVQQEIREVEASQTAYASARGILNGTGSAQAASQTARNRASRDIDTIRFGAKTRSFNQIARSNSIKAERKATQFGIVTDLAKLGATQGGSVGGAG